MTHTELEEQAALFTHYLIRKQPNDMVKRLYVSALSEHAASDDLSRRLFRFVRKHPWALGCVDSACALFYKRSELRRRLYIMFAILEANVEYHDSFLPKKRSSIYIIAVGFSGLKALVKAAIGAVLVKGIR